MKKFSIISLPVVFMAIILLGSSCGKKGCTSNEATNYSPSANKDDGTCRYAGTVVLWLHDSSAQKMMQDSIQSLTIYVDGEIVATQLVSNFFSAAPNCGQVGATTITKDLFGVPARAFSYRIVDDRSIKRWAGVLSFNGNTCEKNELVYFR